MKKHVIALGRQFGSGGREIGRKLSESLGFAYYDRELLKLAAERAEVGEELFADKDEKAGNPWLFKAFYQGGPKVKQGQSAEDVLFQMQSEIIRELEEAGVRDQVKVMIGGAPVTQMWADKIGADAFTADAAEAAAWAKNLALSK